MSLNYTFLWIKIVIVLDYDDVNVQPYLGDIAE